MNSYVFHAWLLAGPVVLEQLAKLAKTLRRELAATG